jgi:hypothetical protein
VEVNNQLQAPAAFFPEIKYPFTYGVGECAEFEAVLKAEDRFLWLQGMEACFIECPYSSKGNRGTLQSL